MKNNSKTTAQNQASSVSVIVSSDDDYTDDSYTYQDIVTKPSSSKEVWYLNWKNNLNYYSKLKIKIKI